MEKPSKIREKTIETPSSRFSGRLESSNTNVGCFLLGFMMFYVATKLQRASYWGPGMLLVGGFNSCFVALSGFA